MPSSTASAEPAAARPPRVLLVAGEASGDVHAGDFVKAFRELAPGAAFFGVGGAGARAAGMDTWFDIRDLATLGLTEVAAKLGRILGIYRRLRRALALERPDLLVLIDFPEFNLALAGVARRRGVPILYYVSPQVWAWRRGRVRKILRRVDRLAAVFPFEPAVYGNSAKVEFVGHPLIDRVRRTSSRETTLRRNGLDPARRLVALLPGSRKREIELLLPDMVRAAELLARGRELSFAVSLAQTVPRALVEAITRGAKVPVAIVANEHYDLVAAADVVLAASGTATLETALLERPMVIAYRMSRTTFAVGKLLIDVPFIGMANLIAGRSVVPELIQDDVTPERLAAEAARVLDDPAHAARMSADLAEVRRALGEGGAARRAAELGLELARGRR